MRADRRRAAVAVRPAGGGQRLAQPVFGGQRRACREPVLDRADQRQRRRREGPDGRGRCLAEPLDQRQARRGDGDAARRQLLLQRVEPGGIRPRRAVAAQQPGPLAQRMLIGGEPRRMLRVEAIDQPVEEAPPLGGSVEEQAVHLRRQPGERQLGGQRRLAAHQPAIDLDQPARPRRIGRRRRVAAGADLDIALRPPDSGRHRPRSWGRRRPRRLGPRPAIERSEQRPAQAAPRRQQRDRLQEVGLAGAVGAGQHHRPRREVELGPDIAAEIAQPQPGKRGSGTLLRQLAAIADGGPTPGRRLR